MARACQGVRLGRRGGRSFYLKVVQNAGTHLPVIRQHRCIQPSDLKITKMTKNIDDLGTQLGLSSMGKRYASSALHQRHLGG